MPELMASIFALKASLTNGLMSRGPSAKEGPAKLELNVAASARQKSLVIENRRMLIQIQRLGHLLHRGYLPPAQALSSPGKQQKDGKARVTALPHSKPPKDRAHAS